MSTATHDVKPTGPVWAGARATTGQPERARPIGSWRPQGHRRPLGDGAAPEKRGRLAGSQLRRILDGSPITVNRGSRDRPGSVFLRPWRGQNHPRPVLTGRKHQAIA